MAGCHRYRRHLTTPTLTILFVFEYTNQPRFSQALALPVGPHMVPLYYVPSMTGVNAGAEPATVDVNSGPSQPSFVAWAPALTGLFPRADRVSQRLPRKSCRGPDEVP